MKLEEMKRIADARQKDWTGVNIYYVATHHRPDMDVFCDENRRTSEFIAMAHQNWDKLMAVVEAVKHNPCRHTADHNTCGTCEAIKALEKE